MSVPLTSLDHVAIGLGRVATQYQSSTNFLAYLTALLSVANEIETAFQEVAVQYDIDQAEGINLDTIGELVGISRILPGGPLNPLTPEQSVLADAQYRLLLRAKIVKNHSHGTNEDVIKGLLYLFNIGYAAIDDRNDMSIGIGIGKMLDSVEIAMLNLLDILPRPGGVMIQYRAMFDGNGYFGFTGQTHALGFGEEGQPTIGGTFAEEF